MGDEREASSASTTTAAPPTSALADLSLSSLPPPAAAASTPPSISTSTNTRPSMQLYTHIEKAADGETGGTLQAALHLLVGDRCCFVWVGEATKTPPLGSLCVATMTPYDTLPVSSTLLRDAAEDDLAQSISHRLAKKTGQQVFVSCSLPPSPQYLHLLAVLERKALEILTEPN